MTINLEAIKKDHDQKLGKMVEKFLALLGKDAELQAMMPDPSVAAIFADENLQLGQAIDAIFAAYSERPALGMRDYRIRTNVATGKNEREYLPAFKTVTFGEHRADIQAIASVWTHDDTLAIAPDSLICIIGFASTEYNALLTAAHYAQVVPVPMQSSTSGADMDEILANINPSLVAATVQDIVMAARHVVAHGSVPTLVVFDYDERDDNDLAMVDQARQLLQEAALATRLLTFQQLVARGRGLDWVFLPARSGTPEEHTALILHSSGSTGKPKGAMLNEVAWKSSWNPSQDRAPMLSVVFAPMNHGIGLLTLALSLRRGSTAYFTLKPDMSTLFEDIRLARPTTLAFFPRVLEMIYQHYQNEVAGKVKAGSQESIARSEVMAAMRHTFLGDRLVAGIVGSAPTPPAVKQFMIDCFDIHLDEGYANTEAGTGRVTSNNVIDRGNVIDYKLRDVPELGYYSTDKPYPRGELCFKTHYQIRGYYKAPEADASLFDEDGYVCSGDIVEEQAPDYVVLIDRRKDVLKLSQGEYVAIGPLGTLFEAGSALIKQIYVYGNSSRSYVLAVVVPDKTAVETQLGSDVSESDLKNCLRNELQRVAGEEDLKSFEVPRDFIIEWEPFSQENGLLSSVRKRLGPALKAKYGPRLEALYEEHDALQRREYEALKDSGCPLSTAGKLLKLLEITLGREGLVASECGNFKELGGDSLGAVSFSLSIEDIFGVKLPVDSLLSPTGSIAKWAEEIGRSMEDDGSRPGFARIHGRNPVGLNADDLRLDSFLGAATLAEAAQAGPPASDEGTVLITGANGFLGRQVCLQWMERLAPIGGKVICLVRALDDAGARKRLDAVFEGATPALADRYRELAANHLEVLAGDAGEPLLGLDESRFRELAAGVDRIVHVAALVNHRLAYEHLFGPNVMGTAEIIRLAAIHHRKPIDFVSTEAVLHLVARTGTGSNEDAPLPGTIPLLDDNYAGGYMASKWAGEQLVTRASRELGVPVNVLRGNMMLAHRSYPQQINYADAFTRLLYSVMLTGLAPASFFARAGEGDPIPPSYDGLPVDVVAAAVVAAPNLKHAGCRTYNINNYHRGDGCHLDAFIDWIESAGYPVTRIESYNEWLTRLEAKLKALPEEQRQHSALDILGAYASPVARTPALVPDTENFRELVAASALGAELPHLDEAYIHKCLEDIASNFSLQRAGHHAPCA
jgi:fatty acid CoA ligase FadD9